jgi:hypothetical protein
MATADDIKAILAALRNHYSDPRTGKPHLMNPTQVSVYTDGLIEFDNAALRAAAATWMKSKRFFPALCELRELLGVVHHSPEKLALLAWAAVERAIRQAGAYRGATFADPAIGETAKRTFGSWEHACAYDRDSPGWHSKKLTFVTLFPMIMHTATEPVTMLGLTGGYDPPLLVHHVEGMPTPPKALSAPGGRNPLAEVQRRFLEARGRGES